MFVCNVKINFKKVLIVSAIITLAIALFFELNSMHKAKFSSSYDYILDENNFTEVLKNVHDNIDTNVGKTIKLTGFVFRLPDFRSNYFVCGRNMMLDGDEKVVGFLCMSDEKVELTDSEWIEVAGTITKGYYTTDMPVIKIESINKVSAPPNTFVKTPDFLNN